MLQSQHTESICLFLLGYNLLVCLYINVWLFLLSLLFKVETANCHRKNMQLKFSRCFMYICNIAIRHYSFQIWLNNCLLILVNERLRLLKVYLLFNGISVSTFTFLCFLAPSWIESNHGGVLIFFWPWRRKPKTAY